MPGLTNDIPSQVSQSLLDHPPSTSASATSNGGQNPEVYIIPEYSLSRNHPQHLLVLPFVPHPSATTQSSNFQPPPAPPPGYFGLRTGTPSYHDPPPDYDTIGHINHGAHFETTGLTPSCSCSTQLTSVADDYGANSLHGIYDNRSGLSTGLSGLDRNEALTASYLYPELLNVTSTRTRTSSSSRRLRPQSSISSTSSTTISTIQQHRRHSSIFNNQRQYLTVKKWVIVVLVLMLLMTISLLVGITMQHFQLLRKFLHSQKSSAALDKEMGGPSTTEEHLVDADIMENFIPK